ncbi:MAG: 4Fe-4S dicluster domain-containing protein [Elusimicrobiota bacterium]
MKKPVAILTDTTLCTGCEECVAACKKENGLGEDRRWRWQSSVSELSASRFTAIIRRPGNRYVRQQCRHCVDPACVSACIVGALRKTEEGAVVYDQDKCIGCRYCMLACPYGIPRYDWEKPIPYIRKCTLCYDRLEEGKAPACVEACPEKATIFGSRSDMLAEAHRRLKRHPGKYVQKVYGEREVGGTSVLYISDIPLDFLGWQTDPGERPLPDLTWAAQRKIPAAALGVFGLMGGTYWVIGRRMQAAARAGLKDAPREGDAPSVGHGHPEQGGALSGLKTALWMPLGVVAAVTIVRFARNLDAAASLGDGALWTLWLALGVAGGTGLGAGIHWLAARRKKAPEEDAEPEEGTPTPPVQASKTSVPKQIAGDGGPKER